MRSGLVRNSKLDTSYSDQSSCKTNATADARSQLEPNRLEAAVARLVKASPAKCTEDSLKRFHHSVLPTLSHLLAAVLHPRPDYPPECTSLVIIDGLNTLIDLDYPRFHFIGISKTEQQRWQAGRRYAVLGSLVTALNKLAVLNNLAVVVTTGCATRMRPDTGLGAALVPGVGGPEWDNGIWTRVVVFRDLAGRFVGVQKRQGHSLISREEVGEVGRVIAFAIAEDGSLSERYAGRGGTESAVPKLLQSPVKRRKRAYDEIADSDGDDVDEYGWADTDESVIADGLGDEAVVQAEDQA